MRKEYIRSKKSQREIWNGKWTVSDIEKELYEAKSSPVFGLFKDFLPPSGKILDAGCGLGGYVLLLKEKGYEVYGIDFSEEAISRLKKYIPSLNVQVTDCEKLPFSDSFFDAYLSLGVIEHIEHGPVKALKEAKRVVKEDGVFIISVPYINYYRRIKDFLIFKILKKKIFLLKTLEGDRNLIKYEKNFSGTMNDNFFQYYFSKKEIKKLMEKVGIKVIYFFHYSILLGLLEINFLRRIYNKIIPSVHQKRKSLKNSGSEENKTQKKNMNFLFPIKKFYRLLSWEKPENLWERVVLTIFRHIFGHMILIIGKKK